MINFRLLTLFFQVDPLKKKPVPPLPLREQAERDNFNFWDKSQYYLLHHQNRKRSPTRMTLGLMISSG
jgi:hypothetical protein